MNLHGEYFANIARANGLYNCPNCGAPIESDKCPYCGTFIVDFACFDTEKPFFMKIKRGDEVLVMKVRLQDICVYESHADMLYADNAPVVLLESRPSVLTANFDVL
jgi:hypothetical protein